MSGVSAMVGGGGLSTVDSRSADKLAMTRVRQQMFRIDAGWLYLAAGLVLCAAGLLIPIQREVMELRHELTVMEAREQAVLEQLAAYHTFLQTVDAREQQTLTRLAASQFNLKPAGHELVLASAGPNAPIAMWIDASVEYEPPRAPEPAQSQLARMAMSQHRLWLLGFGAMCICIGLVMEPPRKTAKQWWARYEIDSDDTETIERATEVGVERLRELSDDDAAIGFVGGSARVDDMDDDDEEVGDVVDVAVEEGRAARGPGQMELFAGLPHLVVSAAEPVDRCACTADMSSGEHMTGDTGDSATLAADTDVDVTSDVEDVAVEVDAPGRIAHIARESDMAVENVADQDTEPSASADHDNDTDTEMMLKEKPDVGLLPAKDAPTITPEVDDDGYEYVYEYEYVEVDDDGDDEAVDDAAVDRVAGAEAVALEDEDEDWDYDFYDDDEEEEDYDDGFADDDDEYEDDEEYDDEDDDFYDDDDEEEDEELFDDDEGELEEDEEYEDEDEDEDLEYDDDEGLDDDEEWEEDEEDI